MKNILVTGIAGFLGSHIAERLVKAGHHVIGIDDLSGGTRENVPDGAHLFEMDICNEFAVNRLFAHIEIDVVIHCAAFASENLSHNCALHTYKSIVMGSGVLLNAAINYSVECFISMSSIAVYGEGSPPFLEDDHCQPCEPYGAAKLCMENALKAAAKNFGINYVIFRPHNIIGTRQSLADSTRNVASIFIRQALTGKPLTIFGDGMQTRAFSPVSHVARIIAACVERQNTWNQTYNIGGSRIMAVKELAVIVAPGHPIEHLPERREVKHAHSMHHAIRQYFPDMEDEDESIEQCIAAMIVEAKRIALPEIKPLPRIEIQRNLNPAWTSQPQTATS